MILDHVELYGVGWLEGTVQLIQEDRANHYQMLMMLAPLARTPMSKEGGRGLDKYARSVRRAINQLTPWRKHSRFAKAHPKAQQGEAVIVLDAGERLPEDFTRGAKVTYGQ